MKKSYSILYIWRIRIYVSYENKAVGKHVGITARFINKRLYSTMKARKKRLKK